MHHWLQRLYENLLLGGRAQQQCGYIQTSWDVPLSPSVSPTVRNRPTYEESRCQEGDKSRKKVFSFFCAPNIVFPPPSVFCIREKKIPCGPPSVNAHTLKSPRKEKKNILGLFLLLHVDTADCQAAWEEVGEGAHQIWMFMVVGEYFF